MSLAKKNIIKYYLKMITLQAPLRTSWMQIWRSCLYGDSGGSFHSASQPVLERISPDVCCKTDAAEPPPSEMFTRHVRYITDFINRMVCLYCFCQDLLIHHLYTWFLPVLCVRLWPSLLRESTFFLDVCYTNFCITTVLLVTCLLPKCIAQTCLFPYSKYKEGSVWPVSPQPVMVHDSPEKSPSLLLAIPIPLLAVMTELEASLSKAMSFG